MKRKIRIVECLQLFIIFLLIAVSVSYEVETFEVGTSSLAFNLNETSMPVYIPTEEEIVIDEEVLEEYVPPIIDEPVVDEVVVTEPVLETLIGNLSWYGPDCYGCSGVTASGHNVITGGIYYDDLTYGSVRIVAGDSSFPLGTIVRITNASLSNDPVFAIVLDRGGAIGLDKKYMFDLLFESESSYNNVHGSTTFEILRYGY